jgi:carboxymethylenebutenolidase
MCRLPGVLLTVPLRVAAVTESHWVSIPPQHPGEVPLRCWWAPPSGTPRAGLLVLPEVFGVNGWVRGVADRLAAAGYGALALPLFSRTAPALDLDYSPESLAEGRSHKERTRAPELLQDLDQARRWLQGSLGSAGAPGAPIGCLGFCFGGHVALLAASLTGITATCDFYGAGVASGRPGGGPPTLGRGGWGARPAPVRLRDGRCLDSSPGCGGPGPGPERSQCRPAIQRSKAPSVVAGARRPRFPL